MSEPETEVASANSNEETMDDATAAKTMASDQSDASEPEVTKEDLENSTMTDQEEEEEEGSDKKEPVAAETAKPSTTTVEAEQGNANNEQAGGGDVLSDYPKTAEESAESPSPSDPATTMEGEVTSNREKSEEPGVVSASDKPQTKVSAPTDAAAAPAVQEPSEQATLEEVSNGEPDDTEVESNILLEDEDGGDAPESFADLETAYSWFADHVQGPSEDAHINKGSEDEEETYPTDEDAPPPPQQQQEEEEKKDSDDTTEHEFKPIKKRNSLIGRVKTVNEEGDTDEDEEPQLEVVEMDDEDPWVIPDSNLRNPNRRICVVTTAGLPWRTGTAVNPLLRALYLTRGRPKHFVTLVIPWCQDEDDRIKTLGNQHSFSNQAEQEEWIRDFCRTRANCEQEEKNLRIMFYPSKYNESMGSIFPSVDICALIPEAEADIAILEEPEHLNWLRIPAPYKESEDDKKPKPTKKANKQKPTLKGREPATAKEKAELGWRFKFRHVVGIIHTNYKAYAEQYGIGAKFITAPALCALNALVVRAYCHKVILLSGTLPSLTPYKEVTCNVHGVRGEFLERPANPSSEKDDDEEHAPVYFIGKLIWAKGFDKILDLENIYREKHDDYFPIDVYGAGGDEKAIKRAFFGRIPQIQRSNSSQSDEEKASSSESDTADVFTWETSLRSHLVDQTPFKESERHASLDDQLAKRRSSIIDPDEIDNIEEPPATPKKRGSILEDLADKVVPVSVLGNLTMSALDTTKATGGAAVEVVKNVVGAGLNVAFTNEAGSPRRQSRQTGEGQKTPKQKLIFEPPQSVFEFRRNPIQARFLGTKDHVLLRDIPKHKVFLNMSITEVLCTTSAEALAMGKFVILPKHPSNTFFLQFPNCLAYTSLEDCLEKLEWALANEPVPLSEESATKLSWEGANERLFDSASVTRDEWEEWAETGKLKSDDDAARFHVETGMTGQLIGKFFTGDKKSKAKEEEP